MNLRALNNLSFSTTRLKILPITPEHLPAMLLIHSQDKVNRYIPYHTWETQDDAKQWYDYVEQRREDGVAQHWAIIDKASQQPIGHCLAFNFHAQPRLIEIGYVLNPTVGGKGFMFEAMDQFTRSLCSKLELQKIIATVQADNSASIKLLCKLGFEQSSRYTDQQGVQVLTFAKLFSD